MGHSHDSRQGAWKAGGQVNNQDLQHRKGSGTQLCFACATLPLLAAASISIHGVVSRPDSSVPEAGKSEARVPACLGFVGALPGCRLGLAAASSLARMTRQLPRVSLTWALVSVIPLPSKINLPHLHLEGTDTLSTARLPQDTSITGNCSFREGKA